MFGRRRAPFKRVINTVNHCVVATTTAAVTELFTALFFGIDASTNRSTHIPAGSVLKKVMVKLWATDTTPVNGAHTCGLFFRPGGQAQTTGYITGWYSATDPLTEDSLEARRGVMSKPMTTVTITGASGPPRLTCFWKGNRLVNDGDDIILAQLDDAITNWRVECHAHFQR